MTPYLITTSEDSVPLLELPDGKFQMLQQGTIAQFASGYQYLLVSRVLARYLKSLKVPQVTLAPATIINRTTGELHHSHTRVFVGKTALPGQLKSLDLDGLEMYAMSGEHYFVSPSLKYALEANAFHYLEFTEGLPTRASAA
jgi:hypothetical protein